METISRTKILKKLSAIQKEVQALAKEGRNTMQNYSYLSEAQITEQFKPLLEKHGVMFLLSTEITSTSPTVKGTQLLTTVKVNFEFVDVESGEAHAGTAVGQGSDANDKGVYKAITGAVKYIFMKTFLIPTGDDPENEKMDFGAKKTDKPPFGKGSADED